MDNIYLKCSNAECHFHINPMTWPGNLPPIPCPLCKSRMDKVESPGSVPESPGSVPESPGSAPESPGSVPETPADAAESRDSNKNDPADWLTALAEDENLWIPGAETSYPAVVAYEYRNLRRFCRESRAYAVLLSLKDNFEALLKLELLLAFAWASQNGDEVFESQTISRLMAPNPSLGTWLDLASVILKDLKKAGMELPACIPLDKIRKEYNRKSIVNWRNEKIGHGAMSLSEDEEFRKDIREKVEILKTLLESIDEQLREQELYLPAEKPGTKPGKSIEAGSSAAGTEPAQNSKAVELILTGADMARGLNRNGMVHFRTRDGGIRFLADPFITIRRHEKNGCGIYFFDNQRTRSVTHFLAYAEGSRTKERQEYFERLRKYLESAGIHMESKADDAYLSEDEIREMDELQMSHEFVKPQHLLKWLSECLEKYESGVFLLKMERGTGKSVFTEKLSGLTEKCLKIADDLDTRTYHFSRTQTAGSEDIQSVIEWLWGREYDGKVWVRAPRISDYEKTGMGPGKALIAFLEEIRQYSIRNRGKNRLLMVMDGMDEISEEGLWDFIPKEEALGQGIYILLTSRDPQSEELPDHVCDHLEALRVTEEKRVGRQNSDNIGFLKEYIGKTKVRVPADEEERMIALADHRVLQLGLLCRLMENGMPAAELPDYSKVVSVYLDALERNYGEKEAVRLRELLAVLCTLGRFEDLTIRSLGALTGENGPTLKLIGMLRDLAPMLKKERGDEGNRFEIANPGLAEELQKQIPETVDTVRWIVDLVMTELYEGNLEKGLEAAAAHVVELADAMLPERAGALGENADRALSSIIRRKENRRLDRSERERLLGYKRQLFLCRKITLREDDRKILEAQEEFAKELRELEYYQEALVMRRQIYEKLKRLCGPNDDETLMAQANMALIMSDLGHHEDALKHRLEVFKLRKKYFGDKNEFTLQVQSNLAVSLSALGKHEESLRIKKDVLRKRKEVLGETDPRTLKTLSNMTDSLRRLHRHEEALKVAQEAYEKKRSVLGADDKSTVISLSNKGVCLFETGRLDEALQTLEEAFEKKKKSWGTKSASTLVTQYFLAATLEALGYTTKALKMYQEIYRIMKNALGDVHMRSVLSKENITEEVLAGKIESLGKGRPLG